MAGAKSPKRFFQGSTLGLVEFAPINWNCVSDPGVFPGWKRAPKLLPRDAKDTLRSSHKVDHAAGGLIRNAIVLPAHAQIDREIASHLNVILHIGAPFAQTVGMLLVVEGSVLRVSAARRVELFEQGSHGTSQIRQQIAGQRGVGPDTGNSRNVLRTRVPGSQSDARNDIECVVAVFGKEAQFKPSLDRVAAAQPRKLIGSLINRGNAALRVRRRKRIRDAVQHQDIRYAVQRWQQAGTSRTGCPRCFELDAGPAADRYGLR